MGDPLLDRTKEGESESVLVFRLIFGPRKSTIPLQIKHLAQKVKCLFSLENPVFGALGAPSCNRMGISPRLDDSGEVWIGVKTPVDD